MIYKNAQLENIKFHFYKMVPSFQKTNKITFLFDEPFYFYYFLYVFPKN
jgi:hypothetical protein